MKLLTIFILFVVVIISSSCYSKKQYCRNNNGDITWKLQSVETQFISKRVKGFTRDQMNRICNIIQETNSNKKEQQ